MGRPVRRLDGAGGEQVDRREICIHQDRNPSPKTEQVGPAVSHHSVCDLTLGRTVSPPSILEKRYGTQTAVGAHTHNRPAPLGH